MKKKYDVEVLGDSQSNFTIEAEEEDVKAFLRFMSLLNEKTHTGELEPYDTMCISITDQETKEVLK